MTTIHTLIQWMENYPYQFLVPPILFFLTLNYFLGAPMVKGGVFALVSFILAHLILLAMKRIFKVEREGREKTGIHRYSFPSYHMGIGSTLCLVQAIILPLTAPIMLILIYITGIGRVRLKMHTPNEVAAGFFTAAAVVFFSYLFVEGIF